MFQTPLVSILIPCFNAKEWIAECIDSALSQSYPNKEVLVVDDGSTDDSSSIVESFGDRIRFERMPHAGGNAVRNRLTQLARGEWLQYLDADDCLLPEKIESQMETAAPMGQKTAVIYSPVIIRNALHATPDYVELIDSEEDVYLTFIRWGVLNTNGLLLRREAVLRVGSWDAGMPCCQEHELLLRLLVAGERFALHNQAGAIYRTHSSETTSRKDPLRVIRLRMQLTDKLESLLKSSGRLSFRHRRALFVSRLECARKAYPLDAELGTMLGAKAMREGLYWVDSSPALPIKYQILLRTMGFPRTEKITAWLRTANPAGNSI